MEERCLAKWKGRSGPDARKWPCRRGTIASPADSGGAMVIRPWPQRGTGYRSVKDIHGKPCLAGFAQAQTS